MSAAKHQVVFDPNRTMLLLIAFLIIHGTSLGWGWYIVAFVVWLLAN